MISSPVVVNALGQLDNPNSPRATGSGARFDLTSEMVTVDERTLADARASGLTAVTITLGYTVGDFLPYEHTLHELDVWDGIVRDHPDALVQVRTAADINDAHRTGKIGVIYGFQNAVAIGADIDRVETFAERGVRVVQLTYNQANHIGDGASAQQNRGLSEFGRSVVEALDDNHVMVDLSHSGERTCLEAAAHARGPVSINHTGCRALVDLPRNKTDEELRLVASRGGFVGIYFMPFVNQTGHARATDVVEHIAHAVNVCGEDHVGIGTDGPITSIDDMDSYRAELVEVVAQRKAAGVGAAGERSDTLPFVIDLGGVDQFRDLAQLLDKRGFSDDRIEKILGKNFLDFAGRVWVP